MQVFPASQLANDPKAVEQLQLGGIDFTVSGTGTYATHIPTLNLTALPYLVETYDQGWKLYDDSKWMQAQFAKGPEKGFRFLSNFEAAFRSMTTKDALNSPADAKGKKLRTFPNEMMRWTLEAIGFNVQIMPLPEVYLAIQQGTVSGQENPIDTIHANKFYEVAPHVTLTKHVYSPIPLTISEKTWSSLSPADRDAITKAAREAAEFSRREEPDDGWLARPDVVRGIGTLRGFGLTYDILVYPRQLPAALALAQAPARSAARGGPPRQARDPGGPPRPWRSDIRRLAALPHVHCKLSGLVTEAAWDRWTPADLRPYLEVALDAFGPARLMIGSDWPVCLVAGDYPGVLDVVRHFIGSLSGGEQAAVLGHTAARFYRIEGSTS